MRIPMIITYLLLTQGQKLGCINRSYDINSHGID